MRRYTSAVFLGLIVFLWRFQIGGASGQLPIYVFFAPLIFVIGQPSFPITKLVALMAAITLLGAISLFQGAVLLSPIRSLLGLILFAIVLTAVHISIMTSMQDSWNRLAQVFRVFLVLQLALQFAEILGVTLFDNKQVPHYFLPIDRPTGLFKEPSHLSMSYSVFIYAAMGHGRRFLNGGLSGFYLMIIAITLLLCPSTTLIAALMLAVGLNLRNLGFRSVTAIMLCATVAVVMVVLERIWLPDTIIERLAGVVELFRAGYITGQSNLSAAVFFGGANAAWVTLKNYPFGVGFLNMAWVYYTPEMAEYLWLVGEKNISDGGSILFKMIAEFGYAGAAFMAYGLLKLSFSKANEHRSATVAAFLFPLAACMVRGASYFDGPVLLAIAVVAFGTARRFLPTRLSPQRTIESRILNKGENDSKKIRAILLWSK